ncbi:MAG: hypothetical protein V4805_04135 [Pseudomonadota bacterium]
MLSATYSLVVLSTEQKKTSTLLSELEKYVQRRAAQNREPVDPVDLSETVHDLSRFHQYCQARKLEMVVIPAIRSASRMADSLLDELESLSAQSVAMLAELQQQLQLAFTYGSEKLAELQTVIELCCARLKRRLEIEENDLFALARDLLPIEAWFVIATKFLSIDAENGEDRAPRPMLLRRAAL